MSDFKDFPGVENLEREKFKDFQDFQEPCTPWYRPSTSNFGPSGLESAATSNTNFLLHLCMSLSVMYSLTIFWQYYSLLPFTGHHLNRAHCLEDKRQGVIYTLHTPQGKLMPPTFALCPLEVSCPDSPPPPNSSQGVLNLLDGEFCFNDLITLRISSLFCVRPIMVILVCTLLIIVNFSVNSKWGMGPFV